MPGTHAWALPVFDSLAKSATPPVLYSDRFVSLVGHPCRPSHALLGERLHGHPETSGCGQSLAYSARKVYNFGKPHDTAADSSVNSMSPPASKYTVTVAGASPPRNSRYGNEDQVNFRVPYPRVSTVLQAVPFVLESHVDLEDNDVPHRR